MDIQETLKLIYPINPGLAPSLRGVITTQSTWLGSELTFHGNKYRVLKTYSLEVRLFVTSGVFKMYIDGVTIENKDRIIAILNKCGLIDIKAAIAAFFTGGQLDGLIAKRKLHLLAFTSDDPLVVKW